MARSFSQEPRSDSHKIGEMRYRMSRLPSTTAIARTLLLAGILLVVTVLAARTFFPAFAQEADGPIEFAENSTDEVAEFSASDQDADDTLTWDFAPNPPQFNLDEDDDLENIFAITDGILRFAKTPDYEVPFNNDANASLERRNTYTVTITVSDNGTPIEMDDETVTVKVTNVDEDGVVELSSQQPLEDVAFVATLSDPDGRVDDDGDTEWPIESDFTDATDLATTTWVWARSDDGESGWTNITATSTANLMIDTNSRVPEAADVNKFLRATVTYTDGFGENRSAQKVSANPVGRNLVNDPPVFQYTAADTLPADTEVGDPIGTATIERPLEENSGPESAVGMPVVAHDPDDDVLTYTLGASADRARFTIESGTGQIKLGDAAAIAGMNLDFETNNPTYTVNVVATDPSGESDNVNVTIRVTGMPEAPTITGAQTIRIEEVTTFGQSSTNIKRDDVGTTTVQISDTGTVQVATYTATDPEDENDNLAITIDRSKRDNNNNFSITNAGGLILSSPLNYEDSAGPSNHIYKVTVMVTDSDGMTFSQPVTVEVVNLNEDGMLTLNHRQPQVETQLIATLTDIDGPLTTGGNSIDWVWEVQRQSTWTAVKTTDDSTSKVNAYGPQAADENNSIRVRATYNDGAGTGRSEEYPFDSSIRAKPASNVAPQFPSTATTTSIAENTDPGQPIGDPIVAEDSDNDDLNSLTYSLGTNGLKFFDIDWNSGQLRTKVPLNREGTRTYRVTLTVRDPSNRSDTISVTITVDDVNEPHSVTSNDIEIVGADAPDVSVDEMTATSTPVATYKATDVDAGEELTWTLGGTDADEFSICNQLRGSQKTCDPAKSTSGGVGRLATQHLDQL